MQQISYVCLRSAVSTASWAYGERIFSVCWLLTPGHTRLINKTLEMRMCHKLNNKMLRDSGFAYRVLASLTTQTVLCCDIVSHSLGACVSLVDSHIKESEMVFYSVFSSCTKRTRTKILIITHISIAPWGPKIQRRLQQRRRTKSVWTDGFSSGA